MKRAFLLPVLVLLVALLLTAALLGLVRLNSASSAGGFASLIEELAPLGLAGLLGACVLVCVRAFRHPLSGVLGSGLLLILLAAGAFGLGLLWSGQSDAAVASRQQIEPGVIYQGDRFALMVTSVTGAQLDGVALVEFPLRSGPSVSFADEGFWDRDENLIAIGDRPPLRVESLPGFGSPGVPPFVRAVGRDLEATLRSLSAEPGATLPLTVPGWIWRAVLALVFAAAGMGFWTGLHLSRWPLINVVVVIAYLRLVLLIPTAAANQTLGTLLGRYLPAWLVAEWPLLGWGTLALVMLILSAILPSLSAWRHAMGYREADS